MGCCGADEDNERKEYQRNTNDAQQDVLFFFSVICLAVLIWKHLFVAALFRSEKQIYIYIYTHTPRDGGFANTTKRYFHM